MGKRKTISVKLDEESELYEEYEGYRTHRDMTKSEAARHLFRLGLDAKDENQVPIFLYSLAAMVGFELGWRVLGPALSISQAGAAMFAVVGAILLAEAGRRAYPAAALAYEKRIAGGAG